MVTLAAVRRSAIAASLLACAAGGLAAALALAGAPVAGAQEGTTATTTAPTATTTAPATTAPPPTTTAPPPTSAPKPKPKPRGPRVIAAGITVGKVLVGGLTAREAEELVRARFRRPLALVLPGGQTLRVAPTELGSALLAGAVRRVAVYRAPLNVPLTVRVSERRLERFVADLARRVDREPVDSRLILRKLRPWPTKERPGAKLNQALLVRKLRHQLLAHVREPLPVPVRELRPAVTRDSFGAVIVIRRGSKLLQLFDGSRLRRTFRVATGLPSYPTPLGAFEIVTKWRDPWWYPPAGSDWAADAEPIPPGPGNPLGTRWMGISSPYIGIHGTPDAASIGYSASHGCIRMLVSQAEWLFERVEIGTPVYIVTA